MRYKEKHTTEALQLRWDNWGEMCEFVQGYFGGGYHPYGDHDTVGLKILTKDGKDEDIIYANQDDYVVKRVDGKGFFVVNQETFEEVYEVVK